MSDLFYVYESKKYNSLYVFKNKQADYMVNSDNEYVCHIVSPDIDSYIYKIQNDYDRALKQLAQRDEAIKVMREHLIRISEIGYYHDYGDHRAVASSAIEKAEQILGGKHE